MSCRIVFLLSVFLFTASAAYGAARLEVKLAGVEPPLTDNIMARLSLYLQRKNESLQDKMIRRLHHRAEAEIHSALAPYGYYHPKITSTLKQTGENWLAEFRIDKGPPVIIEDVALNITGEGKEQEKITKAAAGFPLKKGDILNQELYERAKKNLTRLAYGEGFLDAVFSTRKMLIDVKKNVASLNLVLDTGRRYRFGDTTVSGEVISRRLFAKYLPYSAGDPYAPAKLYELQAILYRTDYFSRVEVRGQPGLADDHAIPVRVALAAPEKLNKYSMGGGYGTDTGARAKLDWSNRLFNSEGHTMSASLQIAQYENIASLLYNIPLEDDPRYDKLIGNVAFQDKTWDDTSTRLLTTSLTREYAAPRYKFGYGLELRDEVYDIGDTSGKSTLCIPSLNGGLVIADDILNTKDGLQLSAGLLGAVEGAGSDATFLQATVGGKGIVTPLENWRLIGRGSLGATSVQSIDMLPPSLRFYTGGDTSIRGYGYKSIGTKDASGAVIGGRYLVVGSIELERVVTQSWSVATFWDTGTATDDLALNFKQGAGVGIRFRLPFGQIRFDVASAVTEDNYPLRFHLNVGSDL